MSIFAWIVIIAVAIFAVLVVIGLLCIAADEGDVYDERDCRATVDRSNGLDGVPAGEDGAPCPFSEEKLEIINRQLEQFNKLVDAIYGEDSLGGGNNAR